MQNTEKDADVKCQSQTQGTQHNTRYEDRVYFPEQAGVRAGQFEQGGVVTKEMGDLGATERQLGEEDQPVAQQGKAEDPSSNNQVDTELRLHDGSVEQRLADGNIAVKGHDNEQDELCAAQGRIEVVLGKAAA